MRIRLCGPVGLAAGIAFSAACVVFDYLCDRIPNHTERYLVHFAGMALFNGTAGYWFGSLHHRLNALAMTDALTGVANRNFFFPAAEKQLALGDRQGHPVSFCLIDLDGFKQHNDRQGHLAGDQLLRRIAGSLQQASRSSDILARYGGDEFVLLMPMTSASEAHTVVRRLQQEATIPPVGLSCGVATFPEDGATLDELLRRADERMYAEKATHHAGSDGTAPRLSPLFHCSRD